jgi:hypothetical protein
MTPRYRRNNVRAVASLTLPARSRIGTWAMTTAPDVPFVDAGHWQSPTPS